jgi:two-component system chemotaxis response regulator CheB
MKLIRVLVVDDFPPNREALTRILESSPFITVVGSASDGEEAIERTVKLRPDLITLDLEMPRMDGFTFLRWLMRAMPIPAIVVSSRADDRSVVQALEFGAVDFLPKPLGAAADLDDLGRVLIDKVKTFSGVEMVKVTRSVMLLEKAVAEKPEAASAQASGISTVDLVAIGASTGGPPAIQAILTRLPGEFPAAIAVSQHMPPKFTRYFAERLDRLCRLEVKEAEDGEPLTPGKALICPGGCHFTFGRMPGGVMAVVRDASPADRYVPSVDAMMKSAAAQYGRRTLGVVLTGMGSDGRDGLGMIRGMGGVTFAESKETAVIYGMPKEAAEAGVVDKVLPLGEMAPEIIRACGR